MAILEATIVSTFQRDLVHKIPGVYPGDYLIPAAAQGDISVCRVPLSHFYIDSGEDTPKFPVIQDPAKVAESIINDLYRAWIETGLDTGPGLFWINGWVPGWIDGTLTEEQAKNNISNLNKYKEEIKKKYPEQVALAKKKQENWARRLVKKADDDWNKWRSHRSISDIHLWAAQFLGLNREYTNLESGKTAETTQCPACATNIMVGVAVCFNCKAILDREKAKQYGLVS